MFQKELLLKSQNRGFHLVHNEIISQLDFISTIKTGMLNLFIQHTSASLAINENAGPTVRTDLEAYFNTSVPENTSYFKHTLEGSDDMPAHIKAIQIGVSINIPITNGQLNLGIWQGIYLCEHRNYGGERKVVATAWGLLKNQI